MKLYYSPGACSLSTHIILCEGNFKFEIEKVDLRAKTTETGKDFNAVSAKGYVPVLILDDGNTLTEGPAITQYLADQRPDLKLAPANGTLARTQLQAWLNYITSELHKNFGPLFKGGTDEEKAKAVEILKKRFGYAEDEFKGPFLSGENFTIADSYLFVVLNWLKVKKLDLDLPKLWAFHARVGSRPAVIKAMQAEGLRTS